MSIYSDLDFLLANSESIISRLDDENRRLRREIFEAESRRISKNSRAKREERELVKQTKDELRHRQERQLEWEQDELRHRQEQEKESKRFERNQNLENFARKTDERIANMELQEKINRDSEVWKMNNFLRNVYKSPSEPEFKLPSKKYSPRSLRTRSISSATFRTRSPQSQIAKNKSKTPSPKSRNINRSPQSQAATNIQINNSRPVSRSKLFNLEHSITYMNWVKNLRSGSRAPSVTRNGAGPRAKSITRPVFR